MALPPISALEKTQKDALVLAHTLQDKEISLVRETLREFLVSDALTLIEEYIRNLPPLFRALFIVPDHNYNIKYLAEQFPAVEFFSYLVSWKADLTVDTSALSLSPLFSPSHPSSTFSSRSFYPPSLSSSYPSSHPSHPSHPSSHPSYPPSLFSPSLSSSTFSSHPSLINSDIETEGKSYFVWISLSCQPLQWMLLKFPSEGSRAEKQAWLGKYAVPQISCRDRNGGQCLNYALPDELYCRKCAPLVTPSKNTLLAQAIYAKVASEKARFLQKISKGDDNSQWEKLDAFFTTAAAVLSLRESGKRKDEDEERKDERREDEKGR